MRMEKLTSKFQMALADAQSLAVGLENQFIEPVHLMMALLDQQGGTARHLLTKSGAKVNLLRSRLGEAVENFPRSKARPAMSTSPPTSTNCSTSPTSSLRIGAISTFRASYSCWPRVTTKGNWDGS